MPINFPSSPTLNQTYAFGQKTWVWNGYAWDLQLANANSVIAISQASYNQANAAFIHANSAFNTANNALDTWVRGQANAAFIQANAAFLQANTPSHVANSAAIYANGAFAAANAASATDATQNNSITAAFNHANSGFITANSAGVYANGAFAQSNIALTQANAAFLKANNALANTPGTTFNGDFLIGSGGKLTVLAVGGDEGGEILLGKPPNGTLAGGVIIDAHQNKIRIFEDSGTNRGVYIDLTGAAASVGTNLLAGGGGSVTSVAGATGAVSNTQLINGIKTVSSSQGITFDYVETANNGQGTNYKVGDDAWIGDTNLSNTIRIKGVQDATNGYIIFGNNDGKSLGRSGSGALTYDSNTIWHSGNDGTGSGLDADLLDGLNSTAFARSSAESYANAAFIAANTPSHVANSAAIYANGAFAAANAATATDATQNNSITAAFIRANNSLNANVGGNITGEVVVVGNLTATTFVTTGSNGTISGANAIFSNYVFAANGTVDLFIYANNAYTTANAAFAAANAATATDATQNNSITVALNTANAAFLQANTPNHVANSAAIYANAAFIRANNSLNANNGGVITGDVTITQNLTVSRDLSVSGNLFVLGNTFSVNASTLVANDSLLVLGTGNYTADILDIGFAGHYNDGTNAHTGLIRDAGTKEWHLFKGYVPEISANNNININDPTFIIDTLNANIDATTVLIKNIDILPYVNIAFDAANAAFIQANTPSHVANSAAIYANGAFAASNAATTTNITQNNSITAAFAHANAAFEQANTGGGGGTVTVSTFNATANGAQTTFAIGFSPVSADAVQVTLDGLIQPETSYTANANANTITFVTAPGNGEQVRVLSFYTGASAFVINDGSITPIKLSASTNNYINSIATAAATTEALAMAAALAIALG